jgi:chromate reductase
MEIIKIFAFAGSLRKDSYNKALLRAAAELLPENTVIEIFDLEGIPLFNQDLELQPTEKVKEFKARIKAADAILIATPEYNYSMPGVLKNAIDWASRPHTDNSFDDKPLAIMGASTGNIATARAQYHLRQSCVFLNMHPLNKPEVLVGVAQEKLDNTGKLTDDKTKEIIKSMLVNLVILVKRLKQK